LSRADIAKLDGLTCIELLKGSSRNVRSSTGERAVESRQDCGIAL
jgi:hypothetical protein